jgi:hypothetical protein
MHLSPGEITKGLCYRRIPFLSHDGQGENDMKRQQAVAIIGLALTIVGFGSTGYLKYLEIYSEYKSFIEVASAEGYPCDHSLKDVIISKAYLTENDSLSVTVVLQNHASDQCTAEVSLLAVGFDADPPEKVREVELSPQSGEVKLIWLLSPTKTGAREIAVGTGVMTWNHGVSVVNTLGLTPGQAKILSLVSTFLGPVLTFPWLFQLWQNRREKNRRNEDEKRIIIP